jgi:hypothetical protein
MIGFVWLLLLGGVVGTSYPHSVWEAHLKRINSFFPWKTVVGLHICYEFDLSQECSTKAVADLLGLGSPVDLTTWTPGDAECNMILDGQLLYFESVASSLFAAAIIRATTVPDFELLIQSWVLRVGHQPLATTFADFVTVINGVTDWSTVSCDRGNLVHDSLTTPLPYFVGPVDCDMLDNAEPPPPFTCESSQCNYENGIYCCLNDYSSDCCAPHEPVFSAECEVPNCAHKADCCVFASTWECCMS